MKPPTTVIAEDEPLLRGEFKESLGRLWPELTVVAEAAVLYRAARDRGDATTAPGGPSETARPLARLSSPENSGDAVQLTPCSAGSAPQNDGFVGSAVAPVAGSRYFERPVTEECPM